MKTYRYKRHSIADPATYRAKEELNSYKQKGTIKRVYDTILSKQIAQQDTLEQINAQVIKRIDQAVALAENSPCPTPHDAYLNIYGQPTFSFLAHSCL